MSAVHCGVGGRSSIAAFTLVEAPTAAAGTGRVEYADAVDAIADSYLIQLRDKAFRPPPGKARLWPSVTAPR
ncbi:hypothetical protein [Kibdelosporangium aridum]|uniref:hypothetical protein n=1 Tax=Kibdelosporangium aridum TaxID=2030 RepID=UPI0035E832EC